MPPFVAHSLGTFFGALTAVVMEHSRSKVVALVVDARFFGGVAASVLSRRPGRIDSLLGAQVSGAGRGSHDKAACFRCRP